ncbi:MAG: hypothetical protein ACON4Z_11255, partial [Planctomycetota bacterium]
RVAVATPARLRGEVYSSLRRPTAAWLAAVVAAPGSPPTIAATCWPEFGAAGREVPWALEFAAPLAEGAAVRAVAWVPAEAAVVAVGPQYRVRGGVLVVDTRP